MTRSKRNFLIGVSIILVCIVIAGCLPSKQGGFTCICTPLFSRIRFMLPGQKPKPPEVTPSQTPSVTLPGQSGTNNGWQALPDLPQEQSALDGKISGLSSTLKSKNVEGSMAYFQPQERDQYRQMFTKSPDMMPKMSAVLSGARLSFLSADSQQYSRVAEYTVMVDGQPFYFQFIKIDGQWMLKNL